MTYTDEETPEDEIGLKKCEMRHEACIVSTASRVPVGEFASHVVEGESLLRKVQVVIMKVTEALLVDEGLE